MKRISQIFICKFVQKRIKYIFYASNEFTKPDGIVDFNKEDNLLTFPGIFTGAPVPLAMVKAYKAIKANEFPDHLDYCA